jgi:Xaa-Pro aminopeptidase
MERGWGARRVKAIFRALERQAKAQVPDVILFHNDTDPHLDLGFFYVTGLVSGIYEGSTAVCRPNGSVDGIVSVLEESSARREGGFRIHVPKRRSKESDLLKRLVGRARTVGIHANELTYAGYRRLKKALPKAKFVDVSSAVLEARMIKDEAEVAAIEEAARIGSRVAEKIPSWLEAGVRESEVAAEMAYLGGRLGAQGNSFDTIAAFGPNAAEPHYTDLTARLKRNQFALFDFGFRYNRYCSDITRTFYFGRPKPKDRRMYETVRRAQDVALDLVKPGAVGKAVHEAAEKVIDATEFRHTFIHGLGHGLGLAVHDGGGLNGRSTLELRPGMVMTVEPGVYLRRYGGVRIEDDVLVTPRGHRMLTTATRDFIAV